MKFSRFLVVSLFSVLTFCCTSQPAPAQILKPVKWEFSSAKNGADEAVLIFTAHIDSNWHLYSQFVGEGGAIPTKFTIPKSKDYDLLGPVKEGKAVKIHDKNFGIDLLYFENKAVFKQRIKIHSSKPFEIKGSVEFMVCDDSRCLPPDGVDFTLQLGPAITVASDRSPDTSSSSQKSARDSVGMSGNDTSVVSDVHQRTGDLMAASAPVSAPRNSSWIILFIAGFLGGIVALFTPCVFPMIPLTVSFFTKKSKTRKEGITNALIYGLSIVLIYVTLGMIITLIFGPDALNALASNAIVNLAFFLIFVVFAISFLGAFEITLPSSWVNKADSASDKGGLLGIFFMASTLSLVSFSCTGPIIGSVLVAAAVEGSVLGPILVMAGFSAALALPFALFAAFPGWLNSLPKSGGWLNTVKVVLGLLELAFALKFLSNVDLAYHWGILKREIFIALWIVIFSILGFYLLGKIKFSHDSDRSHTTISGLLLAILTFSFVIYLLPGMWGAPLKLISGFPPPAYYNEGWGSGGSKAEAGPMVAGTDPAHCPHNLSCFHDYKLALAYARQTGKPLMIDFTGYSCVNCRKMEDNVWSDDLVLNRLRTDFVLVSLYVDDKTELPENEQYLSPVTNRKVKTLGNKWSDLETSRFKTNSQPYYVLLDHRERELVSPVGYTPDIGEYVKYLDMGKDEFRKRAIGH